MKNSFYMSSTFQPIHAQSMFLLNWFSSYLSGTSTLPNGGFVLAATSESNKPRTRTLELLLSQAETRQILSLPQSERPALPPSPIAPFLEATGQAADPVPALDPYVKHDARVLEVFNGKRAKPVEVLRLKGLSKEEARGLMEYWARSGVMRARVSEQFVGERWVVAGGGVVGELERGCIRMRV
jgi:small subunit ribosomal protein S29